MTNVLTQLAFPVMQSWEFDRIALDARGDAAPGARGRRPARCGCAAGGRGRAAGAAFVPAGAPAPVSHRQITLLDPNVVRALCVRVGMTDGM